MPAKQLTANSVQLKDIRVSLGTNPVTGNEEYMLNIRGVVTFSSNMGGGEEIGEQLEIFIGDESPGNQGIMNALINLAEAKLQQQVNL